MRYSYLFFALSIFLITGSAYSQCWTPAQSSIKNKKWECVFFATDQIGYIAGEGNRILLSSDGGINWSPSIAIAGVNFNGVAHLDTTHKEFVVVGDGGQIFDTYDGISFQQVIAGTSTLNFVCSANQITDSTVAFIAGGESGSLWKVTIFKTGGGPGQGLDKYKTVSEMLPSAAQTLRSGTYEPLGTGFIVGDSGLILKIRSDDAWSKLSSPSSRNLRSITNFNNNNTLMIVGDSGLIMTSINNGSTWNVQNFDIPENLYSVSFADNNDGVIVGEDGLIIATTNGGTTWFREASGTFQTLRSVFLYNNTWVCVGDSGTILYTHDLGCSSGYYINKTQVDIMSRVESSTSDSLFITNPSAYSSLTVNCKIIGDSGNNFHLQRSPTSIIPEYTAPLIVSYSPKDTIRENALLIIDNDANWNPDTVSLSGYGVMSIAKLDKDTIDFGIADTTKQDTLLISNIGNMDMIIQGVSVSDTNFAIIHSPSTIPIGSTLPIIVSVKTRLTTDIKSSL
ncbi:MAG TPA: YCF48-related protein, partial [Candidatus Kapabacteria bacterium]|nr:YCF48-related protein [Candidatus Kapabacteria bacterium]